AMQAFSWAPTLDNSVWIRDPRSTRVAAHFYTQQRRTTHVSHDLCGWASTPEWQGSRAELLRSFDRSLGRRHACHRHDRFQRACLDESRRVAAYRPSSLD